MDWERAAVVLKAHRADRYRAGQLARAVFRGAIGSYAEAAVLPKDLRDALEREVPLLSFSPAAERRSADGTVKALLDLRAGGRVETVLMRPTPRRWTACISTQTGCPIGCRFCATGAGGPGRCLSPEEIADQVLFWLQRLRRTAEGGRLSNVVYMGMGEPFLNYDAFAASLRALLDQRLFGIGARHISVSTAGLPREMERFAEDFPQVNLALSLHAASDRLRDELVPINRRHPLAELARTLKKVLAANRRKVFLEYVILRGENDSPRDAADLAAFVGDIDPRLLHVNLLRWNPAGGDGGGRAPTDADARRFQGLLRAQGLICTVRQSFGLDIEAACGQLAARGSQRER